MRTTININKNLLQQLENASELLEISTDTIITLLIKKVIFEDIFNTKFNNSIKYQDADPEKNWEKLHVTLDPHVYEMDLDFRKFFKFSFSFIVSYAILHFLDNILEVFLYKIKQMDNYPSNYTLIVNNYDGIQGFTILWGLPEEKYLKTLIE